MLILLILNLLPATPSIPPLSLHSTPLLCPHARHRSQPGRSTCRSTCAATAETSVQHLPKHLRGTCRSISAATAETSEQHLPKHLRSTCRNICAAPAEAPAQPMLDGDSLPVRYGIHRQREGIVLYQHLEELLRGVFAIGAFEKME